MDYFKIYDTLDSTNKEAQRLLAQGAGINGLTLFARHQTDGRGQLSRVWISGPGSHVAMSIILALDAWLPIGFKLPDGGRARAALFEGSEWTLILDWSAGMGAVPC